MFKDKVFMKKLLSLMGPIVIQSLMLALVALADTVMLGSLEQNYMASVSLATQIQFVQNMFLLSVTASLSILGAQYWGKGDKDTMNDIFCLALKLNGAISLCFCIACVFFPQYLMAIFTNEQVLVDIGVRYLRISGWSYLITGLSQCYLTMMKVSDHAKTTAMISSSVVMINIVLNAVFIFGLGPAPAMDVQGAASATLIARIIELCWAGIISRKEGYIHPKLSGLLRRNKPLEHDFIKCALPLLGAGLFWGIGFTSYSAFMGHLGTDAAGANSIAAVVRDLICCLTAGLSGAAGIVVGNELGAGRLETGKLYGDRILLLSICLGIASSIFMFMVSPIIVNAVKLTDGARADLKGFLMVISVYMIGRAISETNINGTFAAGGDTLFDMYSLAVVMWGIAIPLAVAGTFFLHWSPVVVYACTCLDEVGKVPWVIYHFKKYKWVKDLTRA